MAETTQNLKRMFSDSKVRTVFIFTGIILFVGAVIGYFEFRSRVAGPATHAAVGNVPQNLQSIPGGFETPETIEYARLQEKQNLLQAQQAERSGGSAIPTIIRSGKFGEEGQGTGNEPWQTGADFSTLHQIQDSGGFVPKKLNLTINDKGQGSAVYNDQGCLVGYKGKENNVCDMSGNVIGTVTPDGKIRLNPTGAATGGGLGRPVYDANGKLIGYAGADGVVRDANGNVIGRVGPDGTVRDANGNVIGSATGGSAAAGGLGKPVYDANGKLIGYAGPDGVVHDASGRVIGTVGPDGTVRDATGRVIGSVSAQGKPVYDANGKLIGYAGPDGVVRDANGNIIGKVGPDGTVKDAAGRTLGSVAAERGGIAAGAGRPVYDANGRLIGYAGPDGVVRDANGRVIGTVGTDGVMRDAQGRSIGSAAGGATTAGASSLGRPIYDANGKLIGYAGPDGIVRDASGRVIGTVGPDGTVRDAMGIPIAGPGAGTQPGGALPSIGGGSTEAQTNAALQAAIQRQAAQLSTAQTEQARAQLQATMTTQAGQLIGSWGNAPMQTYVAGSKESEGENAGGNGKGGNAGSGGEASGPNAPVLFKAGTILFAVLDTAVNSDEPGPVLATLVAGPLKGSKLLGSLTTQGQKVMLTFNLLSMPTASKSITINAVAIDPNTARTALSSDTDNHYLLRYGTLFASSFLQGYGQAFQTSGQTVISNGLQTNVANPNLSPAGKFYVALGTVGQKWSDATNNTFNTPPTVRVYSGTGLGILITSDVSGSLS